MSSKDRGASRPKAKKSLNVPFLTATELRKLTPKKYPRILDYYSDDDYEHPELIRGSDVEAGDDSGSDYHAERTDTSSSSDEDDDGGEDHGEKSGYDTVRRGTRVCREARGRMPRRDRGGGSRKRGRGRRMRSRVSVGRGEGGVSEGESDGDIIQKADDGWVDDDTPLQELFFTDDPGMPSGTHTTALCFIQLFLTRELLNFITEETNMYALYCHDVLKKENALNWQGCTVADIAHYLGLAMLMGINRLPSLKFYWSTDPLLANTVYSQVMTYARYQELGRYLHCFNKLNVPPTNKDKLILICPVMEYLQGLCKRHYIPNQNLSLDEGIMPYKGHLSIRTYKSTKAQYIWGKVLFSM